MIEPIGIWLSWLREHYELWGVAAIGAAIYGVGMKLLNIYKTKVDLKRSKLEVAKLNADLGDRKMEKETDDLSERILRFARSQPIRPGATDVAIPLSIEELEGGLKEPKDKILAALEKLRSNNLIRYDPSFQAWIFTR